MDKKSKESSRIIEKEIKKLKKKFSKFFAKLSSFWLDKKMKRKIDLNTWNLINKLKTKAYISNQTKNERAKNLRLNKIYWDKFLKEKRNKEISYQKELHSALYSYHKFIQKIKIKNQTKYRLILRKTKIRNKMILYKKVRSVLKTVMIHYSKSFQNKLKQQYKIIENEKKDIEIKMFRDYRNYQQEFNKYYKTDKSLISLDDFLDKKRKKKKKVKRKRKKIKFK